jgi:DNA-binding NarL/FixJ family response regulator
MRQISVLIIDEHSEVSARLASAIRRVGDLRVVAHTTSPQWAAAMARHWAPQIILVDFKRGSVARADMVRWLKGMSPGSHIVFHSSYYLEHERTDLLKAGADRCLLKGLTVGELGAELRKVVATDGRISVRSTAMRGRLRKEREKAAEAG